jgi:hypothetical protein
MSKITCFELLPQAQQEAIRKDVKEFGYMKPKEIRDLIEKNQFKNKHTYLDPEFCATLDCYIDPENPLFIDKEKNKIFTRTELLDNYPFEEFSTTPEDMFRQQEIGLFIKMVGNRQELDYLMRDICDDDFISTEDNIRSIIRRGHVIERKAVKIAKCNIYVANEEWEEFCLMKKVIKGFQRFIPIEGGASFGQAMQALPWFLSASSVGRSSLTQPLLTNGEAPQKMRPANRKRRPKHNRKSPPKQVDRILEEM